MRCRGIKDQRHRRAHRRASRSGGSAPGGPGVGDRQGPRRGLRHPVRRSRELRAEGCARRLAALRCHVCLTRRVRGRTSRNEEGRTLIIQEDGGKIEAYYGITGKGLGVVAVTVEAGASNITVSFKSGAGNTVILSLHNENWLSGALVRPAGYSEPMDLQRKK